MSNEIIILMLEAMIMYFLVLGAHSLRHRFGPVHFYALIGGITAIMSWVTDAGLVVQVADITFVVGSTVFYTSLLLGVFVVYVFDGPRATRITISTVVGVSILMPLIAAALHFQMNLIGEASVANMPLPSFRINAASVTATLLDLFFLAIAWEFLGKPRFRIGLWFRTWLTLLGVMWLDVFLFATGAFAGTAAYWSIMQGTLVSRFIISLFALPFLYVYLYWQSNVKGIPLENRPVLAILRQVVEMEAELSRAQKEIERRKKAEEALRKSQSLLKATGQMARVGGWELMADTLEVRWTEQTYRIHEMPVDAEEPPLEEALDFYHPEDQEKLTSAIQRALDAGEPYDLELRFITAQGRERWARTICQPHVVDGETVKLKGTFQDITERKRAEEEIERYAAELERSNRELEQFGYVVSHDLQSPLHVVIGYLDLLEDRVDQLDAKSKVYIDHAMDSAEQMEEMIRALLNLSRVETRGREFQPTDVEAVLEHVLGSLGRVIGESDAEVTCDPLPTVMADEAQLARVFQNLIANAIKFRHEGNRPHVHISAAREGDEWLFSVADNGIGFDQEQADRIFHIFQRLHTEEEYPGTGIGLALCKRIVERHGGRIWVESEPGEGSTFYFTLAV